MYRDRDYIEDNEGRILKVVGNYHPDNFVVSYVKYYPDKIFGNRLIQDKGKYSYNTHVPKNFSLLSEEKDRIIFSEKHGGVITATPVSQITRHYSAREKVVEVLNNQKLYSQHTVGKHLLSFLKSINPKFLNKIGITGSFLIDGYNENSDIDLTCYGRDVYTYLKQVFHNSSVIDPYQGERAIQLYNRRMIYMAQLDFQKLIKQENRRLQGVVSGTNIHINCQALIDDDQIGKDFFSSVILHPIGEIEAIVKIKGTKESIYSPCYYEIEVVDILESLFPNELSFIKEIKYLLSFIGSYSCVFHKDEKISVKGLLIRIQQKDKICLGIELTPWNTSKLFSAVLLN